MKLWEKGYNLDQIVETFMTGDDPALDQKLIFYDCIGSIAHAKMLEKIGILTADESHKLSIALRRIIHLAQEGKFVIKPEDEDVHTAIENALVAGMGDMGKKLHTARSRNDQSLLDLRLYGREWILNIGDRMLTVCDSLLAFAKQYQAIPIPGRTHFQRAMPSSLGLWASAFAESLLDDMEILKIAYFLMDQSPLGSAASYGVSLPIDRQYVANLLGFRSVQNNVLYVNNSRGKFEAAVLHALVQIMNDLAKIASDIIVFSAPEFSYLVLPEKFCPGSSLMPQKRNPCPLELIRAKAATVQGCLLQILEIVRPLPSGYNRDFQETKRPFFQGMEVCLSSLTAFHRIFAALEVQQDKCLQAFTPELFATDHVLNLVKEGKPFRNAYKAVAANPGWVQMQDPVENIHSKQHLGATGNLGLEKSHHKLDVYKKWIDQMLAQWSEIQEALLHEKQ